VKRETPLVKQLFWESPLLIVCLVGVVIAVIFVRKYPIPALLTLLAMVILMVSILGPAGAQDYLKGLRFESGSTYGAIPA